MQRLGEAQPGGEKSQIPDDLDRAQHAAGGDRSSLPPAEAFARRGLEPTRRVRFRASGKTARTSSQVCLINQRTAFCCNFTYSGFHNTVSK